MWFTPVGSVGYVVHALVYLTPSESLQVHHFTRPDLLNDVQCPFGGRFRERMKVCPTFFARPVQVQIDDVQYSSVFTISCTLSLPERHMIHFTLGCVDKPRFAQGFTNESLQFSQFFKQQKSYSIPHHGSWLLFEVWGASSSVRSWTRPDKDPGPSDLYFDSNGIPNFPSIPTWELFTALNMFERFIRHGPWAPMDGTRLSSLLKKSDLLLLSVSEKS